MPKSLKKFRSYLLFASIALFYTIPKTYCYAGLEDNSLGAFIDPAISLPGGSLERVATKVEGEKEFSLSVGINYLIASSNDKYTFIMGVGYNYDPISIKFLDPKQGNINEQHNLHYFSLSPLGILLCTDEFFNDNMRFFLRCTLSGKILFSSKVVKSEERSEVLVTDFKKLGLEIGCSAGLEYNFGAETKVGLGFGFVHDFLNKIATHAELHNQTKLEYTSSKILILNLYVLF